MKKIKNKSILIINICIMLTMLFSCKSNDNKVIEKNARKMIEFTWRDYHKSYMDTNDGIKFKFNFENDNVKFECKTDNGSFSIETVKKELKVNADEEICWSPYNKEENIIHKNGFIDVIAKIENNIVGYAVIEIELFEDEVYNGNVLLSKIFPKIDGEYQDISLKYIEIKMNSIKEEYDIIPRI